MRPSRETPNGREELDFLGATLRIARMHIAPVPGPRPPQALRLDELLVIAPIYAAGVLDGARAEAKLLGELFPGSRRLDGSFGDLSAHLTGRRLRNGILHFAGHGRASRGPLGPVHYSIQLRDRELDPMTWRGIYRPGEAHSLLFFNACDIGQNQYVASFIDGWAPAALESGASGHIGGLCPLGDKGAEGFASAFYRDLRFQLIDQEWANVADALSRTRRLFYETGDPTYLAYVFFSDPELRIEDPSH
jgi:CHAT domain-containing protein